MYLVYEYSSNSWKEKHDGVEVQYISRYIYTCICPVAYGINFVFVAADCTSGPTRGEDMPTLLGHMRSPPFFSRVSFA